MSLRINGVEQGTFIFDSIKNLPNPNLTPAGTVFVAKNALFTAICVPHPDDSTKQIWWPTQSATPINYNPTATNGAASTNGINRFGVYNPATNTWLQATAIGQACNGVSLSSVAAGGQMQWVGVGIQPVARGANLTAGQFVMSDAAGQAIPWDGDVNKTKLGMSLLTTTGTLPQILLFSQTL